MGALGPLGGLAGASGPCSAAGGLRLTIFDRRCPLALATHTWRLALALALAVGDRWQATGDRVSALATGVCQLHTDAYFGVSGRTRGPPFALHALALAQALAQALALALAASLGSDVGGETAGFWQSFGRLFTCLARHEEGLVHAG